MKQDSSEVAYTSRAAVADTDSQKVWRRAYERCRQPGVVLVAGAAVQMSCC
jgi:hypothetical protein